MKIFKLSTYAIVASILASSSAFAASTSGTANARVVTPIAVAAGTALEFGSFASGATSGTINQAGVVTGGVTAVSGGATRSAGTFTVTGESSTNTSYTFTLPSSVNLSGPGPAMPVALSFASGTAARTLVSGSDTVTVNGILTAAAVGTQTAGSYTGTYTVTAVY